MTTSLFLPEKQAPARAGLGRPRAGGPTPRQLRVLREIKRWTAKHGNAPSVRELGAELGIASTNGVVDTLRRLRAHGVITWNPGKARSIRILNPNEKKIAQAAFFERWDGQKDRFWSLVDKSAADGCWRWTGLFTNGVATFSGEEWSGPPHRVAWEFSNGPLGDSTLTRTCATETCVKPVHYRKGKQAQQEEFNRTVYFFQLGDSGPIKIGVARSFERRLAVVETHSPYPVRILLTMPGSYRLERELHERFRAHHLRREWFQPAPELLAFIDTAKKGD
jgi:hypothetical protein